MSKQITQLFSIFTVWGSILLSSDYKHLLFCNLHCESQLLLYLKVCFDDEILVFYENAGTHPYFRYFSNIFTPFFVFDHSREIHICFGELQVTHNYLFYLKMVLTSILKRTVSTHLNNMDPGFELKYIKIIKRINITCVKLKHKL